MSFVNVRAIPPVAEDIERKCQLRYAYRGRGLRWRWANIPMMPQWITFGDDMVGAVV